MGRLIRYPDNHACPRCGLQMPLFGWGLVHEKDRRKGKWFYCPACDAKLEWHVRRALVWGAICSLVGGGLPVAAEAPWVGLIFLALIWLVAGSFTPVAFATWQPPLEGPRHDDDPISLKRLRFRRGALRATILFISVYVGVCLLAFGLQSKMVYFPKKGLSDTPASAGLAYENVTFDAEDGVTLHGWWVPADNAVGTVLYCHGNAGNIAGRVDTLPMLHRMHLNVFMFDYRGYGRSEGSPSEEGTYLDADAAWRHLSETRGVKADELIIFGRSLGGAIAAHLAWKRPACALILESTFTSIPDLGAQVYPFLPVRLLCRIKYDTRAIIADVDCPVLIVHSPDDDIVPFSHSKALREARPGCEFLEIHGPHNGGWIESGDVYVNGLKDFIDMRLRTQRKLRTLDEERLTE